MRDGINFKVDREIGAGTFVVNAYRFGMFTGALRGHLDNRACAGCIPCVGLSDCAALLRDPL